MEFVMVFYVCVQNVAYFGYQSRFFIVEGRVKKSKIILGYRKISMLKIGSSLSACNFHFISGKPAGQNDSQQSTFKKKHPIWDNV